jgi:hypothetical protein
VARQFSPLEVLSKSLSSNQTLTFPTTFDMSSKSSETEHQPFLSYSDDPTIEEAKPTRQFYHMEGRRTGLLSHILVFVTTSLLWMLVLYAISSPSKHWYSTSKISGRHNVTSNAKLITCGNSTQEARALGCKYDILLNNWIPEPCIDQEFIDEYRDDGSWASFADEEMTKQLTSVDEISEMDFYYTSVRDHVNHCAVMWKKQFAELFDERKAFDTIIASPGHTDHCADYLMGATGRNQTEPTKVFRGFAGCWIRQ